MSVARLPIEVVSSLREADEQLSFAIGFWDETEAILKQAEQINQAMIVPAISELRYGGRKLVDFVRALSSGASSDDSRTHLEDFVQCAVRARHDAVDATVNYIVGYLEELERRVDADLIQAQFPDYLAMKKILLGVCQGIVQSRRDRERRNEIYSEIITNSLNRIVHEYQQLDLSRHSVFAKQEERDRSQRRVAWSFSISLSLVAGAIIAVVAF